MGPPCVSRLGSRAGIIGGYIRAWPRASGSGRAAGARGRHRKAGVDQERPGAAGLLEPALLLVERPDVEERPALRPRLQRGSFCKACGGQKFACSSCPCSSEADAIACVECGVRIGEPAQPLADTKPHAAAVPPGRSNTLSFQEQQDQPPFEASLTDAAMQSVRPSLRRFVHSARPSGCLHTCRRSGASCAGYQW